MIEHDNQRKWLQAAVAGGHIIQIPFATFDQAEVVARGAFGEVSRAYWKSAEKIVALKNLYSNPVMGAEGSFEEFVRELQLIRSVDFHDNVIRFYGVSEDPTTHRYFMVLQYANGGNLRDFLNKNHELLSWETRIRMAKEIASGIKCIHGCNIVHRDLHSKNILVHDGKMMITDFGLSKSLDNNETSLVGGMVGYIEPQCFINSTYKRDKASDIYSLGVLLWELSSGRPPFNNMAILDIARDIIQGKREAPIEGSPPAYVKIYQMAWDNDQRRRPTINKVREDLERLQPSNDLEILMGELTINQQVVSSPVNELGNFSNFGMQNQQPPGIPLGVTDSMNPNNKGMIDNYVRSNNNNMGQLMSPPNSNEISIKQNAESYKQNSLSIQNLPFGVASSMSPLRSNTVSTIRNDYLNTAPIPNVNYGQTQNSQIPQAPSNQQQNQYQNYSNMPTTNPIRPQQQNTVNFPQANRPPPNQQPNQYQQNYSNVPTAIRPQQNTVNFPQVNNRPPSNQFPQNVTQNLVVQGGNSIHQSQSNQFPPTFSMPVANNRSHTLSYIPQVQPSQQQLSQPQQRPQLSQPQPPYQQQLSQPQQRPQLSQPQLPYQQQLSQPQQRPQLSQPQPPYQQQLSQPQQRPQLSQPQPPYQQQFSQPQPPYQQQPLQPQQRPYQPPQPQPQQRPYQPPQPQSQLQPQSQPQQRPYQPPQPQPQPYQQPRSYQQQPQSYQRSPQPQSQPQHQPQHQLQHHSNQYQFPPQQNFQVQPQRANTNSYQYQQNQQPPYQPHQQNQQPPHQHPSQHQQIIHPSQNPHKCTCEDIISKYVEEYQNTRGFIEPGECHAGYHAGMGDIVGLRWHLYNDRRVDGNYNFHDMSDKLVLITAQYCGRNNLNVIFQCLKEYGANFEVTTKRKGQTAFHLLYYNLALCKKITYNKDKLERYQKVLFQAIKFLKEVGCNINAKDKDGMTILSHFLGEKFLHQERLPIIQALLDNGADPNISITLKNWDEFEAKTALLQAVRYKWPTSALELIIKHGVDVKAVNKDGMNALAVATQAKDLATMTWMLDNISIVSDNDSIKIAKRFAGNFSKEHNLLSKKKNKVFPNDLSSFSSSSSTSSNASKKEKRK